MDGAIIFDVDGTLSETEETHRKAFNRAFEEAGLSWHWDRHLYNKLLAVTGGKEALGEATVRITEDGRIFTGRGISTDIIEASAKAYVDAINRMVAAKSKGEQPGVKAEL